MAAAMSIENLNGRTGAANNYAELDSAAPPYKKASPSPSRNGPCGTSTSSADATPLQPKVEPGQTSKANAPLATDAQYGQTAAARLLPVNQ